MSRLILVSPIFVSQEVMDLLNALKASSVGKPLAECHEAAKVVLVDNGLARVQPEDKENGRPAKLKALPSAWTTNVQVGG